MAPTRETMVRSCPSGRRVLRQPCGDREDLKLGQLVAAADYANQVADQLREIVAKMRADERARRKAKRAERLARSKWRVDEHGVLCMTKGMPA